MQQASHYKSMPPNEYSNIINKLSLFFKLQIEALQVYQGIIAQEQTALDAAELSRLVLYLEAEAGLVTKIKNLQQVIMPLEQLLQSRYPLRAYPADHESIVLLKIQITTLQQQVSTGIHRIRQQLYNATGTVRQELQRLRKSRLYRPTGRQAARPAVIDITR